MTDLNGALAAAHQANIRRYQQLLRTELTLLERQFIHRRLSEECRALEELRSECRPRETAAGPPGPAITDASPARAAMSGSP
jgi:hypothetical protein